MSTTKIIIGKNSTSITIQVDDSGSFWTFNLKFCSSCAVNIFDINSSDIGKYSTNVSSSLYFFSLPEIWYVSVLVFGTIVNSFISSLFI